MHEYIYTPLNTIHTYHIITSRLVNYREMSVFHKFIRG